MNVLNLDLEIAKLEKRKARYQERSPSPPISLSFSSSSKIGIRASSPKLPVPNHLGRLPDTEDKIVFLDSLGLARISDKEKEGKQASVILPTFFLESKIYLIK